MCVLISNLSRPYKVRRRIPLRWRRGWRPETGGRQAPPAPRRCPRGPELGLSRPSLSGGGGAADRTKGGTTAQELCLRAPPHRLAQTLGEGTPHLRLLSEPGLVGPQLKTRHPAGGAGPRPEADLPEVTGLCEDRPLPPARAGDPASHPNPCREAERATRASPLCTRCQALSLLGSNPHLQSGLTVLPPHRHRRTRPSANGRQPDNTTAVTARSHRIADGRGTPRPTGRGSALETQRPGPGLWERGDTPQAAVGSLTFPEKRLSSANNRHELDKMMLQILV